MTIASMCLIFNAWKEKWWKSLIPIYGIYIIYKHTWEKQRWLFLVPVILNVIGARCMSFIKKDIAANIFDTVKTYIETEQLNIDIGTAPLVVGMILFLISTLISFVLTRITYMKICGSLHIKNKVLKIGTFLFPQVFLLLNYIYYKKRSYSL